MPKNNSAILRIDDIGASTKRFEVYSRIPGANLLFLKYLRPFRAWGPYREMNASEWEQVFSLLERFQASLTVGITASWVEADGTCVPFPKKFPQEASILRQGLRRELIEIANHGLTHCVVGKHLPRLFTSNREFHREFWSDFSESLHREHMIQSQKILQGYFECPVITFVPPGNVWSAVTEHCAVQEGIRYLASRSDQFPSVPRQSELQYVSDNLGVIFHDRELVLEGVSWLEKILKRLQVDGKRGVSIRRFMPDDRKDSSL